MSNSISLQRLSEYLAENVEKIGAVRSEIEEVQVGFNSAYVERKAEHDVTLERLSHAVTEKLGEVGAALQDRIEARVAEERRIIVDRRQELRESLVPEARTEADETLGSGQRLTDELRQLNPRLDQSEEELKAQRADLERELIRLNQEIRRLSGFLGVVFNFIKITRLDRQRQRVIGRLEIVQKELRKVREQWKAVQQQAQGDQMTLQQRWQELTLRLAELQGELEYLDDEASRESLTLRRAARHVIDNLKQPIDCRVEELQQELDSMVDLNIQTDDYQEGLGSVSGLMSLLDGISAGLKRFDESVQGLIQEQRMHSAHLPELNVLVPPEVLAFFDQWDALGRKVQDDRRLCNHPAEFVAAVRPATEQDLSEANIQTAFENLGEALDRATARWTG